jgi:uncharacterized protein
MLSLLPDYADPGRLCGLGKAYEGELALSEFPRLAAMLADTSGSARFRLAFLRDAAKRCVVEVEVDAVLMLRCQRCLGAFAEPVSGQARLAVVRGPVEAERLPDDLDPLLVNAEQVALRALIEDELILAVPSAPMHRPEDCDVDLRQVNAPRAEDSGAGQAGQAPTRPSPFAALDGLRRDGKTKN